MTSKLTSGKPTGFISISSNTANRIIFAFIIALLGLVIFGAPLSAQTPASSYAGFPTCSATDGRFLTIAGTGYNTLVNSEVVLKIGSPGVATSIEIGVFDGETGGMWDRGNTRLKYVLYADPTGNGIGTTKVVEFSATDMVDNGWKSYTVTNVEAARAPNGNYLYRLVVNSNSRDDNYWSSFKVRTNGTIALKAQAFAVCATANTDHDLAVIYPAGTGNLDNTTYDGTWQFFLDVPTKASSISIWDGDMDFGSYDCSVKDIDDPNTPNLVLPSWAIEETARLEGVGLGSACYGSIGFSTGAPPDDSRYPMYRRSPSIYYEVLTPQGQIFTNSNPSGSLEWEEFKISTGAHDPYLNDAHADSLPAGIYQLRIIGMDLANLNAWRLSSDAIGVSESGAPVPVVRAYSIEGNVNYGAGSSVNTLITDYFSGRGKRNKSKTTVSNTVYSTANLIPNVQVVLTGDLNGDNVTDITQTATTDANGDYMFPNLAPGTYSVAVACSTLPAGSIATNDFDGIATPNTSAVAITEGCVNPDRVDFNYRLSASGTSTGGTRTQGYWKTHPNEWTLYSIMMGCTVYDREQAITIMENPVSGDMTYAMFEQLAAAKLNVAGGSIANCILWPIVEAEQWLCAHPLGSNVSATSNAWTGGADDLHKLLDDYNNGRLCAPHIN